MNKVFWITGLSGAGKTTIGKELYKLMKRKEINTIFLDGDKLREVFGQDLGYSKEARFQCAMRYSRLCRLLAEQDMNVIICTISMFDEVRGWNRENIAGYYEVYIKVPIDILKERDQKGLYSGIENGSSEEVAGVNLAVELPKQSDLLIENLGNINPIQLAEKIMEMADG